MNKEELIEKFKPYMDGWRQRQSVIFAEKCAEIAIEYATSQTSHLQKENEELRKDLTFCIEIINEEVDDFKLLQNDVDRLKELGVTF